MLQAMRQPIDSVANRFPVS